MEEEMESVWFVTVGKRGDSTFEPMPCMVFTDEDMAKSWVKQNNKDNDLLRYQVGGRILLNRQVWVEQDSWEKLREDIESWVNHGSVRDYYGDDSYCRTICEDRSACKPNSPDDPECIDDALCDIIRRIEKLAVVNEDE